MSEVGTLKKGLDILWLIIERGNLSVLEIMEILHYNRSTTYRLVNTLEQNQLIQKTGETTYEVADRLIEKLTGLNTNVNFDLNLGIVRAASEFKETIKETIFVGVLKGSQLLATHIIPGSYPTRTHYEIGEGLPAHASAAGKCIVAFQPPQAQEIFTNNLKAKLSIEDDAFLEELEHVRTVGFAIDNEEAEAGVRCVAAPIWRDGSVVAAIAITGPSARMSKEMDEKNSKLIKQFSRKITESLEHPRLGGVYHAQ